MRFLLRPILAFALLFGSGLPDWAPVQAASHESCCCRNAADPGNACPCPKPEGNQAPRGACATRPAAVASFTNVRRAEQGQKRREPRPEPATWAQENTASECAGWFVPARGRDPDLGRHLARLSTFRI